MAMVVTRRVFGGYRQLPLEATVPLLSRRQVHAVLAGTAAAATYLAAAEIGSHRRVRLTGLFILASTAMAGMATSVVRREACPKALAVESRFNNLINNGGSVGGNFTVQGVHNAAGGLQIKGTSFTLNHGTVSVPGGGPSSYDPVYESAQSAAIANLQNKLSSSNIL